MFSCFENSSHYYLLILLNNLFLIFRWTNLQIHLQTNVQFDFLDTIMDQTFYINSHLVPSEHKFFYLMY